MCIKVRYVHFVAIALLLCVNLFLPIKLPSGQVKLMSLSALVSLELVLCCKDCHLHATLDAVGALYSGPCCS